MDHFKAAAIAAVHGVIAGLMIVKVIAMVIVYLYGPPA